MSSSKEEKGCYKGYLAVKEKFDAAREKLVREAKQKYEADPIICEVCKEKVPYEQRKSVIKYCSRSCAAKANNLKRSKIIQVKCLNFNCSNEFKTYRTSSGNAKRFCNAKCQQDFLKEENYKKLLDGQQHNLGHDAIRNILIYKHGARCMGGPTEDTKDCRWDKINPSTGKCPIELEHIDGDSNNNKLENLKLLCPSCHSLTPTYKALNKGNGRHERMKRYKEGKSF